MRRFPYGTTTLMSRRNCNSPTKAMAPPASYASRKLRQQGGAILDQPRCPPDRLAIWLLVQTCCSIRCLIYQPRPALQDSWHWKATTSNDTDFSSFSKKIGSSTFAWKPPSARVQFHLAQS